MSVLNFSDFARRRPSLPAEVAAAVLPVTDRWAMLHSSANVDDAADTRPLAQVMDFAQVQPMDFWGDLLLRLAYPTHRLRKH